jgi:hypothetical protein
VIPAPDIPGHTITGVLGTGGFATVYRSWQVAVGRDVAVKVDSRVLLSERDQRRFFREVTAAGRLSGHPHVIDVYDAGTLGDGRPYLVMELCPAGSLNDELHRSGPMRAARVRGIGTGIADALAAAHAGGVLHRDIKPANILINRYGVVGLSDFGLASIVATSGEQSVTRDALTPAYAPPESFRCEEPTPAADLYSLAATLYALLAGRPPRFPAEARSPGLATILALHDQPVDDVPGAPPGLLAVLRRCLAADPASRLPTAAALRDALAALPEGPVRAPRGPEPAHAPFPESAPSPARPPSVPRARRPVPAGSAGPVGGSPPYAGLAEGSPPYPGPGEGSPFRTVPAGPGARSIVAERAAQAVTLAPHRLPAVRAAALVGGGLVLIVAAAAVAIGMYLHAPRITPATRAHSRGDAAMGTAVGTFGIPTVTSGCPAALVRAAAARCPQTPECWNGVVEISGNATASSLPCRQPHVWETFAIALLPSDVSTFDVNIVQANPAVRAVCSLPVLLRSRRARARLIPSQSWEIDVLPPDEAAFSSGARAYRCLARAQTGLDPRTSQFTR